MLHLNGRSLAFWLLLWVALVVGAHSTALAGPVIDLGGVHNLAQNQANQIVDIFVTGGQSVQGLNFNVQISDGGSPTFGTSVNAPKITSVDLLTNTIFFGNNTGYPTGQPAFSTNKEYWVASTTTSSGNVSANGKLARLTIDTTGFFASGSPHTFALKLSGLNSGDPDTDFLTSTGELPASFTTGSINIVTALPEPSSLILLVFGGLGVGLFARLRRNRV